MKNIIKKLENSSINFEINNYGSNYFGSDFIVKGLYIPVRNYGVAENCEENVNTILKAITRTGKYIIIDSGSYGKISYTVYKVTDYNALMKYKEDVKKISSRFWEIMHESGKDAADIFYRNECRRYNFKVVGMAV